MGTLATQVGDGKIVDKARKAKEQASKALLAARSGSGSSKMLVRPGIVRPDWRIEKEFIASCCCLGLGKSR